MGNGESMPKMGSGYFRIKVQAIDMLDHGSKIKKMVLGDKKP